MEHRWGHRVPVDINVQLACRPDAIGAGRLIEVSASGGFVRTKLHPPVLTHVELTMYDGTQRLEVAAYVARRCHTGIGIEWCEFAPAAICAILSAPLESDDALSRQQSAGARA
jgi:hypothetical protein